jgi:hypothetical protein
MIDDGKAIGRDHMRVLKQTLEVVHRHDGHVGLLQNLAPFSRAPGFKDARELGIDDVDIRRAAGEGRKFRILAKIIAAGGLEEVFPLLVVVDDDADIAVRSLVRPPVRRQMPRVTAAVERRFRR